MAPICTLREWRTRHGVTQEQLSATTGIAQSLLSKYERGPWVPGLQNALAIEKATGGEVPVETWAREPAEVTSLVAAPAALVPVVDAEVISVEDRRPASLGALKAVAGVFAVGLFFGLLS